MRILEQIPQQQFMFTIFKSSVQSYMVEGQSRAYEFLSSETRKVHTCLAQTPEIGQGLGRFLSCGARKQEQT